MDTPKTGDVLKCELHFRDADELWAWVELPPTVAQKVRRCPHCGYSLDQERADLDKISDVLIFKAGYYYLSLPILDGAIHPLMPQGYQIVPESWGLNNGFEYPADAYSYLIHLQERIKVG